MSKNLELTLKWNKIEIANNDIFDGNEKFKTKELEDIMHKALLSNNANFVQLLIENKFNFDDFLKKERIISLFEHNNQVNSFL